MRSSVGSLVSSEASLLGLQVAALLPVLTYLVLTSVLSVSSAPLARTPVIELGPIHKNSF